MEQKGSGPGSLDNKPRTIFVKEEFLSHIESGKKTCELRIAYKSFSQIKPEQVLEFKSSQENRSVRVKVVAVRKYQDLESLMEKEDINKIAPGVSLEQVSVIFEQNFNAADVKRYGLVVIEFEKINEYGEEELEREIATMIATHQKYYDEMLMRTDLDPDYKEHVLARTKDELELFRSQPVPTFIAFTNNFLAKFPNGLQWGFAEQKKNEGRMDEHSLNEIKRNDDLEEILKELSANPGLVSEILNIQERRDISQEAYNLMKRVYIAMRNKGYTHNDLAI